ncbi:XRE family transcriptional regulator [Micromonospora fluostatini]|uniref:XRE family transcriptional regulator n=1 Tax=Micromonospora fluostatini TaxID=1629071 RepID=A0ABY2DKT3_9ACTN|nr:XRE family transcriptional regulator [Micromonospora fluostatini]
MNEPLRAAMAEAGQTAESLAEQVGVDPKTTSRWVNPGQTPHPRHRLAAARALGRTVGELWPEVVRRREPDWFLPWAEIERKASTLRAFEPSVLPGLLQTPEYAHAVLSSGPLGDDEVEGYVTARLARQAAVFDRPRPALTIFVVDEAALRRGEPEIMHPQLDHLVTMAERPRVMLHVLPLRAGFHPGQAGAFVIASIDDADDLGYLDDQAAGRVVRDVAPLWRVWDTVRSVALPRDQSIRLLKTREWLTRAWPT